MAKEKKEKVNKNPKLWDGAETEHTLTVGQKVTVEHFGLVKKGWEVLELQFHGDTGLACYKLLDTSGTKWPSVGKWNNVAVCTRIIGW